MTNLQGLRYSKVEYKMKRSVEWLVIIGTMVLALVLYLAGVYLLPNFVDLAKSAVVAAPSVPEKEVLQRKNDTELVAADPGSPVANIDLNEIQLAADAQIAKYTGWRQSRGQFVSSELGDYRSYNDDTLTTLGKQGDLKALRVLSVRLLLSGDIKRSAHFANIAVVFGSTQALQELSELVGPTFAPKDSAQARAAALEALALTKVIEIRGDIELAEQTRNAFAIANRVDLSLTPEEKSFVDSRASEIYAKFQAIRTAKGLGDFDNSPSPFAKTQ